MDGYCYSRRRQSSRPAVPTAGFFLLLPDLEGVSLPSYFVNALPEGGVVPSSTFEEILGIAVNRTERRVTFMEGPGCCIHLRLYGTPALRVQRAWTEYAC